MRVEVIQAEGVKLDRPGIEYVVRLAEQPGNICPRDNNVGLAGEVGANEGFVYAIILRTKISKSSEHMELGLQTLE